MKNTWRHLFRRLAASCAVAGATAWSSAMCYAQIAYDDASDPVYANGWQEGDNGGSGFEPWNFDTDFGLPGNAPQQKIDSSSQFNALGTAWTLYNTTGPPGGDVARAGRGFAPLEVGETIRVVFDNPTEQRFFRGYFVRLNSRNGQPGGGSICYGGSPCTPGTSPTPKLGLNIFEYFTYGQWGVGDGDEVGPFLIPLFDIDTADDGAQLDVTLTAPDTYELKLTPLANPSMAHTQTGMLETPGEPIDWLEFTFFNTATEDGFDTDFFIRSIEIIGNAPPGVDGDYNEDGTVNAADYTVWRDNLGASMALPNEDATPGMVTSEDYTVWKANFGQTITGSALGAMAVPEPGTFVVLVAAFAGLAAFKLRRMPSTTSIPTDSRVYERARRT